MASPRVLIFFHRLWLAVVPVSCIGLTIDICFASTSTPSFAGFLFLFWPIWVSLNMYLYGSLCSLRNHVPRYPALARVVTLYDRVFKRPRTGAATLIGLSIVWLLTLPTVMITFWVFLFFQVPQWWTRWMIKGVPSFVVVPYVLFMCLTMTVAWSSCLIWVFVRAIKAGWSVRTVLQDLATEEEQQRLELHADDEETIVGDDSSLVFGDNSRKSGPKLSATPV